MERLSTVIAFSLWSSRFEQMLFSRQRKPTDIPLSRVRITKWINHGQPTSTWLTLFRPCYLHEPFLCALIRLMRLDILGSTRRIWRTGWDTFAWVQCSRRYDVIKRVAWEDCNQQVQWEDECRSQYSRWLCVLNPTRSLKVTREGLDVCSGVLSTALSAVWYKTLSGRYCIPLSPRTSSVVRSRDFMCCVVDGLMYILNMS